MPELPEAETIARDLRGRVVGKTVTRVEVAKPDVLAPGLTARRLGAGLRGHAIRDVGRRGKNVVLRFDDGRVLVVNLGMTGRLVFSGAPRAAELRHVAARLFLDDGHAILYDDIRRFGRMALLSAAEWEEAQERLGIEPLSDELTAERLYALTRGSRVAIRNWLLDQTKLAGVGNIYANEALFRAGIRPTRRAGTLTRRETAALRDALRDVLTEAIAARGTTVSDYRDSAGEPGGFGPRLRVYDREGEPCPVCGTPIKRVAIGGRSAFYCPRCQT
ncbi:MAG: bifunctional DNA-formamidopyrimidine glycosylase/DNA-(apurinic or apyrimidinic site) lyase [bacterium]|nr:MAG: formamidopyrimidine-DNA glycosylase [bacterium]